MKNLGRFNYVRGKMCGLNWFVMVEVNASISAMEDSHL